VNGILAKSLRDHRRGAIGWAIGLSAIAVMYSAFYPSILDSADQLQGYIDKLPEAIRGLIGGRDFTSPAGYLQTELFSVMGPVLMLVWAIGAGSRAIAGEEERGTLDTLLSTPLRRRTILTAKALAIVVVAIALTAVLVVVLQLIGPPFDLSVPFADLVAGCVMLGLLGLAFAGIALAIGSWTGHRAMAASVAGGYAAFAYILHALAPSVDALAPLHPLSVFRWYLNPDALATGLHAANVLVLAGIAVVGFLAAWVGFERRDLTV
jgi:ABC-2 type transport system permease protein